MTKRTMAGRFAARLDEVLGTQGDAPALQFGDRWYGWSDLAALGGPLEAALAAAGAGEGAAVAIVLRNTPEGVAALLSLLAGGRVPILISPIQPPDGVGRDATAARAGVIVAQGQDWTPALIDAAKAAGAAGLELVRAPALTVVARVDRDVAVGGDPYRPPAGTGLVLPTSGTTGPPKRIPLPIAKLDDHLADDGAELPPAARSTAIIAAPLHTITGLRQLLRWATRPLKLALMERLDVRAWAELAHQHKPKIAGLPPAAMRMMLDAGIAPEKLASVRAWYTGSAPLDPALATAFEQRFGIPVLLSYGATEFGGPVAGWTLADHRAFAAAKRGSTGRAYPGIALRIVDQEDGRPLSSGHVGLLQVRAGDPPAGDAWIGTNDLARIDEDGFLFIEGRADDVIIRGGFKVPLREVETILLQHPAVRQAAAIGLADDRLGQVPGAAIALEPGAIATGDDILAWFRGRAAPYKAPVIVLIVDALPMNASLKVDRPALARLLERAMSAPVSRSGA